MPERSGEDEREKRAAKRQWEPENSVEGWIIIVTNIHEEAQEEDFRDMLKEFGSLKDLHMNLDRRTGYLKGYAVAQFEKEGDASDAIKGLNGRDFLGQDLKASWCFVRSSGGEERRH